MNFRNVMIVLFILSIVLTFSQCGKDDSTPKPVTPTTPTTPAVDPDPSTSDIPSTAPTTCDYEFDQDYKDNLDDLGWTLAFEDNFDSDLSKWNTWSGGAYNNELQLYQPSNLEVSDGQLVITVKKETVSGNTTPYNTTQKSFDFTSGRIESKTLFSAKSGVSHVRIMARIKLPAGYGMWPGFWTYGDPWPTQGEIDIIEARGQEPTKYQTNYFYGTSANTNLVSGAEGHITADADLTTCYHVYEMIWEKTKLISLLDGKVVEAKTSGGYISSMFGTEQKIVLNIAVGGLFFSGLDPDLIAPGTMYVDWVKVYTAK